jgi:hypothetical protein
MTTGQRQPVEGSGPGGKNCRSFARRLAGVLGGNWGRIAFLAIGLLALFGAPRLGAQAHDEQAVKAALVYNLTKYVEWPQAKADNTLLIGFIGEPSAGETLKSLLTGKPSESRSIRVISLPSDEVLMRCGVLYISHSPPGKARAAMEKVRGRSILTVSDAASFAQGGGMVGLITRGDQVHIEINLEAVQTGGLRVSSRLLSLATLVTTAKAGK